MSGRETSETEVPEVQSVVQQRAAAVAQMSHQLLKKFRRLERTLNDMRSANIRYYWDIGRICREIRDNAKYVGKDGENGLRLVERALSTQARTLRKAMQFADLYDEEAVRRLVNLRNDETGFRLNWGHVGYLVTLEAREQRERFAQEAVEKMLDPSTLAELIKRRTERSGGHGRRHVMPPTVQAQLSQMLKVCRTWQAKNDTIWNGAEESVFGNLMTLPPEEVEEHMLEQLSELRTFMLTIQESAAANSGRIVRAMTYLQEALASQESDAEAAVTGGPRRAPRALNLATGE